MAGRRGHLVGRHLRQMLKKDCAAESEDGCAGASADIHRSAHLPGRSAQQGAMHEACPQVAAALPPCTARLTIQRCSVSPFMMSYSLKWLQTKDMQCRQ